MKDNLDLIEWAEDLEWYYDDEVGEFYTYIEGVMYSVPVPVMRRFYDAQKSVMEKRGINERD